jgi:hypothetical protein
MEHGTTDVLKAPSSRLKATVRFAKWLTFGAGLVATMLLLLAMPALHAQTTAQISGTVTDSTGAVVPGASVTLVNEATQDTRVVKTDGAGLYSFPALLPSSYTIKVMAKGFQPTNLIGGTDRNG